MSAESIERLSSTIMGLTARLILVGVLGFTCLILIGCGSERGLPTKVLHGDVSCDGQKVPTGMVLFVPVEGTPGPTSVGRIVDGQYRIDARGGVPIGKHRVQVEARMKTGRQVLGYNGRETIMVDEEVRMGPELYAGEQSPLTAAIRADSDGTFDIVIPR